MLIAKVVLLLGSGIGHLVTHLYYCISTSAHNITDVVYTTPNCFRFLTTDDKNTSIHTTHCVIVHFIRVDDLDFFLGCIYLLIWNSCETLLLGFNDLSWIWNKVWNDRTQTTMNSSYLVVGRAPWSQISPNKFRILLECNAIGEARSGTVKQ